MGEHIHSRAGDLLPNESVKRRPDEKRATMKLDGTITYGNIMTVLGAIVSVAIGWGAITARQDATDSRAAEAKKEFTSAIADIKDSIREQRLETKDLQKSMNAITTDTALIRGRLAGNDGPGARSK